MFLIEYNFSTSKVLETQGQVGLHLYGFQFLHPKKPPNKLHGHFKRNKPIQKLEQHVRTHCRILRLQNTSYNFLQFCFWCAKNDLNFVIGCAWVPQSAQSLQPRLKWLKIGSHFHLQKCVHVSSPHHIPDLLLNTTFRLLMWGKTPKNIESATQKHNFLELQNNK